MALFDWWTSRQALEHEVRTLRAELAAYERLRTMLRDGSGEGETLAEGPFRALVQNASDFISIVAQDGTIRYKSPSVTCILGYARSEMRDTTVLEYVHPEDAPAMLEVFKRSLAQPGLGPTVQCRFRHQDGSWRHIEATLTNLLDDPDVSGVVINARDVTERIKLEAQLRQAQKLEAVGQLASGLAHDFNNILSIVLANAALIAPALPDGTSEARADLRDLVVAGRDGADMIKKLLGFSRQADLLIEPIDLMPVVEETGRLLRRLLPSSIDVQVAADEPQAGRVLADPTALRQILLNLATNARDAMPEGGTLRLDVKAAALDETFSGQHPDAKPGRYGCVAVSDTGTGMDEATRQRVFEPFFTTKPAGRGTGLGMAMIYGLVKQHNGLVNVYSEPGRGTRVSVYLPEPAGRPAPRLSRRSVSLDGMPRGTETVLLAEDNDALRRTGQRALETFGYSVVTARDGAEALALFRSHPGIDLVISDVVMPKLGGRELLAALRQERPAVRFVFASGYAARQVLDDAEQGQGGSVFFLTKPWTLDDLARTVREALDARPAGVSA